jgi:hypothetical protein
MYIEGVKREFKFRAETPRERKEWTNIITLHIQDAKKHKNDDFCRRLEDNFWKKSEKVTTKTFIDEADSGDIVLFRGKKLGAAITRGVTQSEYDHIAMVLKFEDDNQVYIIDATLAGVNITSWDQV